MKSAEYERADHQPHRGPVNRPLTSHEELKRACGKTAAVVLATDFGTTPLTVQFENDAREPVTCGKADEGKAGIPRCSSAAIKFALPLLICMKYAKRPAGSPHSTSGPRGFNGTGARRFSCRARSLRGLTRPACATFALADRTAPCRASL